MNSHLSIIILFILSISTNINTQNTTTSSIANSPCLIQGDTANCENINSWSELDLSSAISIQILRLNPKTPLKLDASLDLKPFEALFEDNYAVYLENILSFSFSANPFDSINKKASSLEIENSNLDFFIDNDQSLSNYCAFITDLDFKPLFASFKTVRLGRNVKFHYSAYCPLIFQNADMDKFILDYQAQSIGLQIGPLMPANGHTSGDLNSKIQQLVIKESYSIILGSNLLDSFVFKDIKLFAYRSNLASYNFQVQTNLFESFGWLRSFHLDIENLDSYKNNQNFEWFSSLNGNVSVNLLDTSELADPATRNKEFKLILGDMSGSYEFPDQDFCLFKNFPHSKWVFPFINTKPDLECSCTLIWLIKYWRYYSNSTELQTASLNKCNLDENFEDLVKGCEFEKKIDECNKCSFDQDSAHLDCSDVEDLGHLDMFQAASINSFRIKPLSRIRLDRSLYLQGFYYKLRNNFSLTLENLNGFDFDSSPLSQMPQRGRLLNLSDVDFEFFRGSGAPLLSSNCAFGNGFNFRFVF